MPRRFSCRTLCHPLIFHVLKVGLKEVSSKGQRGSDDSIMDNPDGLLKGSGKPLSEDRVHSTNDTLPQCQKCRNITLAFGDEECDDGQGQNKADLSFEDQVFDNIVCRRQLVCSPITHKNNLAINFGDDRCSKAKNINTAQLNFNNIGHGSGFCIELNFGDNNCNGNSNHNTAKIEIVFNNEKRVRVADIDNGQKQRTVLINSCGSSNVTRKRRCNEESTEENSKHQCRENEDSGFVNEEMPTIRK
uniref:Uncharacterized protein n=1 Tax=Plectus sambesii TaxID=2011161 RepID=A0A914W607_9BILA